MFIKRKACNHNKPSITISASGWHRAILYLPAILITFLGFPYLLSNLLTRKEIFDISSAPHKKVAIVFGAGLRNDGTPTTVLRDRIVTASELYFSGKVDHILMSGTTRYRRNYNEPLSMYRYAIKLGVPENVIFLDPYGYRTYDTCARAYKVYQIQNAHLVTQQYHLPRALFTSHLLGTKYSGVIADKRKYDGPDLIFWNLRELPATLVAMMDVWFRKPTDYSEMETL